MLLARHRRTLGWLVVVAGIAITSMFVEINDRAGATFRVRPVARAAVAGFVRELYCEQGDRVSPAQAVARIEVPELDSLVAEKREEVREARAALCLRQIGPRPQAGGAA